MKTSEVLAKADLQVQDFIDDGGYLNPEQSDTFIRKLTVPTSMMGLVRVVPMSAPERKINKIGIGRRILRPTPGSGIALPSHDRVSPYTEQVVLVTKEMKAAVNLPDDVLEDSIERGNLESTVMDLITEQVGIDSEELVLCGDTAAVTGGTGLDGEVMDAETAAFRAQMSGVLKLGTVNVFDASADTLSMDKEVCKQSILTMPKQYKRLRPSMRFLMSDNNHTEYLDTLSDRVGGALSDAAVEGKAGVSPFGVKTIAVPFMPETRMLFLNPKNLIWGIWRKIKVETGRDIQAGVLMIVVTLRVGFQIEELDAIVQATGITAA